MASGTYSNSKMIVEKHVLVGGFNPFEKYWSKWESSPNRGEHKKNIWNYHPVFFFIWNCTLDILQERKKSIYNSTNKKTPFNTVDFFRNAAQPPGDVGP